MKRPNILFLMSDEHRADVTGCYGNDIVRTPTLDRLANEGVVFDNAYTPSPICMPARQCIAAGQLPKTCDCLSYGQDLPPFSRTFAQQFSRFGYMTTCAGKLHHTGPDQMQGWRNRIGDNANVAFHHVEGAIEELKAPPTTSNKWSDAKEILRAGVGHGPITQDSDAYSLEGALTFLQNYYCNPYYDRVRNEEPLFLKVSFVRPHYPYFTTEERFSYYLNRVPLYLETEAFDHPFLSQRQVVPGKDATERDIRRATAAYYGMIDEIDHDYQRVLDAIEAAGQDLDDWIIVYTSDHGEMLGEHGIWEKQKFFEASARVPLIVRWPKGFKGGKRIQENVNLCDLYATLCDLAGIDTPDGLDSRSLKPLIEGDTNDWNNETISHFGETNLMIKHDALKYQFYGDDLPEVLFDLERDPSELTNCIEDPQYAEALIGFRARRDALGYGRNANPNYINACY